MKKIFFFVPLGTGLLALILDLLQCTKSDINFSQVSHSLWIALLSIPFYFYPIYLSMKRAFPALSKYITPASHWLISAAFPFLLYAILSPFSMIVPLSGPFSMTFHAPLEFKYAAFLPGMASHFIIQEVSRNFRSQIPVTFSEALGKKYETNITIIAAALQSDRSLAALAQIPEVRDSFRLVKFSGNQPNDVLWEKPLSGKYTPQSRLISLPDNSLVIIDDCHIERYGNRDSSVQVIPILESRKQKSPPCLIRDVAMDASGSIWLGGAFCQSGHCQGLVKIVPEVGLATYLPLDESIGQERVSALAIGQDENIYAAVEGRNIALFRISPSGTIDTDYEFQSHLTLRNYQNHNIRGLSAGEDGRIVMHLSGPNHEYLGNFGTNGDVFELTKDAENIPERFFQKSPSLGIDLDHQADIVKRYFDPSTKE